MDISTHLRQWRTGLWLAVLLITALPAPAAEKIVLSSGVLAPYTTPDRKGFLDLLIKAVFQELGMEAELLIYPTATERGMLKATLSNRGAPA